MARPPAGFFIGDAVVNLDVFLPRLMPYVLGCPEPLAKQALLDAAIEFCNRSHAVSLALDPITVVKGIPTYEVETPTQTGVATVLKVWYEGNIITSLPYESATALFNHPNGTPRYYFGQYVDEVFSITLLPTPEKTVANGLQVRVALTPNRDATQVHDILFDRYVDDIVQGAIGIICAVPDQPFSDTAQATVASMRARVGANHARGEIMHGNVQSSLSVKMRAF